MAGFGQEIQTYPVYFSFKLKNRSRGDAAKQPGPERLSQGSGSSCCRLSCQGPHAVRPREGGRWTQEGGVHGSKELPIPTPKEASSAVLNSLEGALTHLQRAVSDGQRRVTAAIFKTIHTSICYLLICSSE